MNQTNQLLTMPSLIGNATTSVVLREFADELWNTMLNNDRSITSIKNIYDLSVNDLLNENKKNEIKNETKKQKEKPTKKPSIPIPFYGFVENSWCCGIKKNHGLYTQCPKARPENGVYCAVCLRQANNNANGKPNCGDIRDRAAVWSDKLDYKPPGMKKEIPYANVIRKLNIDINDANEITERLGWDAIPECHLIEKKVRRGRPKTKIVVEDSDDEEPKKRGRPRKVKEREPTNEELIAQFMEQTI